MSTDYPAVKFGAFFGPYHLPKIDSNFALRNDLELIDHLDHLGFAEAWVGEHHSGGVELICSPEIFVAAAAERTQRIKLGLGVVSLPYHHPFLVADRVLQLDHMTRGRVIFGAGPGQLADDSRMVGINPLDNRRKMEEAFSVIYRLFQGETVTEETDWYKMDGAYLQMKPYSDIEMACTATVSPNGPNLAGKYGASLLSLAATNPAGVGLLANWEIATQIAAENGQSVSRANWRLVGIMHIAETEEQAREECRYGLLELLNYLSQVSPGGVEYDDYDKLVDDYNESGFTVIGTPEMAIRQIQRLQEMSGGFGTWLNLQGDWADPSATRRSYELIAAEVAPHFNGDAAVRRRGYDMVVTSDHKTGNITAEGQRIAKERFEAQRAAAGKS
jgi:limonene 1,2-monooxygenase